MDKLDSNIVFDRLYMDLSQEERDKLSPMQLEDYTAKLQDRKKEVLAELEKEIADSERSIVEVNDAIKDHWRAKAKGKRNRDGYTMGGGGDNLFQLIQRRSQLAEYIVAMGSQHDWLTGTEMKQ